MTRPGVERDEPVGRRVARWRVRRRMTQQMLADRLGKSKSWVDKVERGARNLDRYSLVQEIAEVLRLDPAVLLDPHKPASTTLTALDGIDAVRAALAHYHQRRAHNLPADEVRRHLAHAWLTYQHAQYAQLLRALPALLDATHDTPGLLVPAYRITASVLVKLGEPDLAWLAADRAVTAATGNPVRAGAATIAVAQALRALGRDRLALTAAVAAVGTTADDGVRGTLLLQAAMAAAGCGHGRRADDLIDRAAALADRRTGTDDPHHTAFGPAAVRLAHFASVLHLGDAAQAVCRHEEASAATAGVDYPPSIGPLTFSTPPAPTSRPATSPLPGVPWPTPTPSRPARSVTGLPLVPSSLRSRTAAGQPPAWRDSPRSSGSPGERNAIGRPVEGARRLYEASCLGDAVPGHPPDSVRRTGCRQSGWPLLLIHPFASSNGNGGVVWFPAAPRQAYVMGGFALFHAGR
ncbi:helix-turn-helix domain-containing protein [Micromonospora parva]|uniref:helix-turn-helix domain-containing protein n=1 Tax=Micromonospora parva TaxID=1464048 RepID=UPI0033CDCD3F